MSNVQYGKKIITGMTNFSTSGKVEICGDSRAKIITKMYINMSIARSDLSDSK